MKIAVVSKPRWQLPPSGEGIWAPGIVIANEAAGLTAQGHEVTVFAAKGSRVAGQLVDFGYPPLGQDQPPVAEPQASIREPFRSNSFIKQVIEHLRQHPVDIVHLHDYREYPLFAAARLPMPLVVTLHGDFELNFKDTPQYILDELADVNLIVLTEPTAIPAGMRPPVGIVPNTFDAQQFEFVAEPLDRLVYVGRITAGKGADLAVEAAALTGRQLDIYGSNFTPEGFEETFKQALAASPTAHHHGPLKRDRVAEGFNGRALLFPIRNPEGFPLVVLEALSSGTPVVTFDVGGMRDIVVDGKTGFVVPAGDMKAFAAAVERIDELDRAACRADVLERFNQTRVAQRQVEVFQRVIDDFKPQ